VWEIRNAYKILVGKFEWKRLLGDIGIDEEDNIKMDLKETECKCELDSCDLG
jgi:hypothetical protein